MGRNVIRVTASRSSAMSESKRLNKSFRSRGIKRQTYVGPISKEFVQKRTRKGFTVRKKNFAIFARNKR